MHGVWICEISGMRASRYTARRWQNSIYVAFGGMCLAIVHGTCKEDSPKKLDTIYQVACMVHLFCCNLNDGLETLSRPSAPSDDRTMNETFHVCRTTVTVNTDLCTFPFQVIEDYAAACLVIVLLHVVTEL